MSVQDKMDQVDALRKKYLEIVEGYHHEVIMSVSAAVFAEIVGFICKDEARIKELYANLAKQAIAFSKLDHGDTFLQAAPNTTQEETTETERQAAWDVPKPSRFN